MLLLFPLSNFKALSDKALFFGENIPLQKKKSAPLGKENKEAQKSVTVLFLNPSFYSVHVLKTKQYLSGSGPLKYIFQGRRDAQNFHLIHCLCDFIS